MKVQIISDVVCPWCRIGKHNLDQAAAEFTAETGELVEVVMLPFLLDPIQPEEADEGFIERFVKRKGMSLDQVQHMFQQVTDIGKSYGLTFNFDRIKVAVNTVPAHELIGLTPTDKRNFLMDALMAAYFERGEDVGDFDTMLRIAREDGGLTAEDISEIEPALRRGDARSRVLGLVRQFQEMGVDGVPFFITDDRLAVQGGQPPRVFADALRQALSMRTDASAASEEADA